MLNGFPRGRRFRFHERGGSWLCEAQKWLGQGSPNAATSCETSGLISAATIFTAVAT